MEHLDFIAKYIENLKLKAVTARPEKGHIILDVGTGSGRFLSKLVEKFGVRGVGIDPYTTHYKDKNIELVPLKAEDVDKLEFTFNLAYTIHSFHHISHPDKFLSKLPLVLKPDGIFIIIDWKKGANTGIPERYYSREEFESMLKKYGFEIMEIRETSMEIFIAAKRRKET